MIKATQSAARADADRDAPLLNSKLGVMAPEWVSHPSTTGSRGPARTSFAPISTTPRCRMDLKWIGMAGVNQKKFVMRERMQLTTTDDGEKPSSRS
jgi:hypothetical protein